ncbi:hypothetical protein [Burkholderia pseudomallei]|uniref:hypothetical protein n=1 Tax=Burkholderia pseudomallei TaxID=28450 RepID=UPI000F0E4D7C|nr:hypothetical protein [Burkholderia pseudomallei]VBY03545.1 Uncharacterised protein [Burkholderia pseudomallei]
MKPYAKDARHDDRNSDTYDAEDQRVPEGFDAWYEHLLSMRFITTSEVEMLE